MKVSVKDISNAFNELINDARSREDISDWAIKLMAAGDKANLEYEPSEAEKVIWDGLQYLSGVDLRNTPQSYLHNKSDFINYWESIKKRLGQRRLC